MEQIRAISPVFGVQPEGWNLDAVFVDWLTIRQPNDGRYSCLNDGRVIRLDVSGEVIYETVLSREVPGSFDSSLRLRVTPTFVEISGNPSRFDREDNLLGFRFEDCIAVFNRVLASFDLPPLVESSRRRISRRRGAPDCGISGVTDELGYRVLRCDVTLNVATGSSGNLAAYVRFLGQQTMPRKRTSRFKGTVSYRAKWLTITVYDKAREMRAHGLSGNREAVADWCDEQGIARVEIRMNRDYLKRNGLRCGLSHDKLVTVFEKEVRALSKVCEDFDTSELTFPQLSLLLAWRAGYETRELVHKNTWYPHRKRIKEVTGFDIGQEPPVRFEPKRKRIVTRALRRDEYPPEFRPECKE